MPRWQDLIRTIPDFPTPGVRFRDIMPMLADAEAFVASIDAIADPWRGTVLDAVIGVESRGFILGAALARALGTGFAPVRKAGKLPGQTLMLDYSLEYSHGQLEIHADALHPGARVILVDDVLATGGTLVAALQLAQRQGAEVIGASVLFELDEFRGRDYWHRHTGLPLLIATDG
ncbi:MAG: adenine phosphoribosyltransferase [Xanthomonadaceae bacterium]|jgi:adenine phosphoribosyltransferase|nr:adenine phosphoribosyltransferase [Xanthomonadaceae bacterium]